MRIEVRLDPLYDAPPGFSRRAREEGTILTRYDEDTANTDIFTPEKRSEVMAGIGSGNTKPELVVRSLLHRMGYRFRLHRKDLPGTPDIVLPGYRSVIFVHGCFWHRHPGCRRATMPKGNREFWREKLQRNRQRDVEVQGRLEELGWNVIVLWECRIMKVRKDASPLAAFLHEALQAGREREGCDS